ncbi:MAG: DUF1697 domain-containing protein [Actinobacteria bacterium]|nr:DUF1697 domain-containing protein [Actinomycetota bacterium]
MARYAAFLRAVNLGSNRKASSEELAAAFQAAGLEDVATFQTSGNVVFEAPGRTAEAKLVEAIERGLAEELGFEVPVFLRGADRAREIAAKRPFPARAVDASKGKVQVALLASAPPAAAKKRVMSLASERDRLTIDGAELYWLPSGGTQESTLDLRAIASAVGPSTVRTQGTIERLAAKYF